MDLLHRIRWANVARAAALAAAVLLVAAWPRLRAEPPPLPPQPKLEEGTPAKPAAAEELAFEAETSDRPAEAPRAGRQTTSTRQRRARRRTRAAKRVGAHRAAGGADPVAEVPLSTGATGSVAAGVPRSGPTGPVAAGVPGSGPTGQRQEFGFEGP
jgi:hypothetical protein